MTNKQVKNPFPVGVGASGELVKDIQERLVLLGSTVKATGKFTIGTMSAVKSWQKKNKLQITGKIGAAQYKKLVSMTDPLKKPAKKKTLRKTKA